MNMGYRMEGEMSDFNNMICDAPATQISLSDLGSGDVIVIETQNSRYEFSVLDPLSGHGLLSGGSLASDVQWAFLVGALDDRSGDAAVDLACLKTDARALFYLETLMGFRSLILSKVIRIIHTRSERG